jgi:hypothetical protein
MDFSSLSPERLQLLQPEKLMVAVVQEPDQPPASTVNVLPFITSSLSEPDWLTETERAKAPTESIRNVNRTANTGMNAFGFIKALLPPAAGRP